MSERWPQPDKQDADEQRDLQVGALAWATMFHSRQGEKHAKNARRAVLPTAVVAAGVGLAELFSRWGIPQDLLVGLGSLSLGRASLEYNRYLLSKKRASRANKQAVELLIANLPEE